MVDKYPSTMRAWQFSGTKGGLPANLKLNSQAQVPEPKPNQHLVKVHAVGLNPVDYKVSENWLASVLLIRKPATPGIDFSGIIIKAASDSSFRSGDRVFGWGGNSPFAGGMMAEYGIVEKDNLVLLPSCMTAVEGAAVGVASMTAYQSIKPKVKPGDRVFINGGSGGCGLFGIQIAKALGLDVTVSCSTRNLETCKSFGADEVLDYTKRPLPEALVESAQKKKYDLVIDNVSNDIELYWQAHRYTSSHASFVVIAGSPTLRFVFNNMKMALIPGFLGGGRRRSEGFLAKNVQKDLEQVKAWIVEKMVKVPIDTIFDFEQAPQAYEKLKTSRAVGKIVVNVSSVE